ncbi:2'-5' RNA ligase family protein [Micromonospora carbonacea]|uniref:2'-5' RNA ligase family protein n=1 Tax=Micromonospora carbonacea TaxID=47853 RepID=UPI003D731C66
MSDLVEHVDSLRDHWWWRPGWRAGRHFYACHFTMSGYGDLVELIQRYQVALRSFPGLDLIPPPWLHLTMQGLGFLDDLADDQIAEIERAIRQKLAQTPAPVVTFHRPVVRPEAIYLPALPPEPVAAVRNAVRAVIGDVLGADNVELAPEHVQGYRPHVSVAYSNTSQPAEPIAVALTQVDAAPVKVTLDHVDLLEFHRDNRMYEWTRSQQVRIAH